MEDIARKAVEYAQKKGADYTDIRVGRRYFEKLIFENNRVENAVAESDEGAGIRVLIGGNWGFYATADLSLHEIYKAAENAVAVAKGACKRIKEPIKLAPIRIAKDKDYVEVAKTFDAFPIEDRIDLARACSDAMRDSGDCIHHTSIDIDAERLYKIFHSSEGALIQFDCMRCYAELTAIAHAGGSTEKQTIAVGGTGGFEKIADVDTLGLSKNLAKKACEMLEASAPSSEKCNVVLHPSISTIVHEIIGHPSEADRVMGREAAWAGITWWKDKIGEKIGSDLLNASDDSRIKDSLGYFKYDDEGVPATEKVIIKNGVLSGYIQSRETAKILGVEPNGGVRVSSPKFFPLIRMSNTFIKAGDWTPEEIIRDTKRGVYMGGWREHAIDSQRLSWTLNSQWGYLIEKGELTTPLRGVMIMGNSPLFFKSIDAVGKDLEMTHLAGCGKGDPPQFIPVGVGAPHIRTVAEVLGRGD